MTTVVSRVCMGAGPLIVSFIAIVIIAAGSAVAFVLYRNMLREAKIMNEA